jgi:hypothetical protein
VSIPPTFGSIGSIDGQYDNHIGFQFDFPNADTVYVPQGTYTIGCRAISAKKIILSNSVTSLGAGA